MTRVLVDTSVMSLALRRQPSRSTRHTRRLDRAFADGDVVLTGAVLQELLQGLGPGPLRDQLVEQLSRISLLMPSRSDHVMAAQVFTTCKQKGVQLSTVDALLAALCIRRDMTILTTDNDFRHAAEHIDLRVWPDESET